MKNPFQPRPLRVAVLATLCVTGEVVIGQPVQNNKNSPSYVSHPISSLAEDWRADRVVPANPLRNVEQYEGRSNVIQFGIVPPESQHSFYNWQGYTQRMKAPAGNSIVGGDLWVSKAWAKGSETEYVRTGMWSAAMPKETVAAGAYVDSKTSMPIVSFTNEKGGGRFEVWDRTTNPTSGWVDLPKTAEFLHYDGWNTIDMRLLPDDHKIEYYLNGHLIHTWSKPLGSDGSQPEQFWSLFLNARNNGSTSFETHWSDLLSGELIAGGQAIADTTGDVVVAPPVDGEIAPTIVTNGAKINGTLTAKGTEAVQAVVKFDGDATIKQDISASHAVIDFSGDSAATSTIDGNVHLEASKTSGGTISHPIEVSGDVIVDRESTLGGNWKVTGNLYNAGRMKPGNSIGEIRGEHNATLTPDSVNQFEVSATGASDQVNMLGHTVLAGKVNVLTPNGYRAGHPYVIMTAQGGFEGTQFDASQVSWDRPDTVFLAPRLTYEAQRVLLTIDRSGTAYALVAQTPNQTAVAKALDSLLLSHEASNAVSRLTDAHEASKAFDQLSGELHASTQSMLIEDSRFVRDAVTERVRSTFAKSVDRPANAGPAGGNDGGAWARSFGSWGRANGAEGVSGVNHSTSGVLLGVDTWVNDAWRAGVMGGYSRSRFDVMGQSSSGKRDNYYVGIYGGTQVGRLGLHAGASYTWSDIETDRSVGFSGYSDSLRSDYGALTKQVFGDIGYTLSTDPIAIEPFANIAYVNLRSQAFQERGAAAALIGQPGRANTTFSTLGVRGVVSVNVNRAILRVTGSLGWRHAYGALNSTATLTFSGSSPFTVTGVSIARDAALVEAGLDAVLGKNISIGVAYAGQIGSSVENHSVIGRFVYRW